MATGYRIQDFPAHELLDGPQTSMSHNDYTERPGKSVCLTIEDLATYFAQAGVPLGDNPILVEVEGDWEMDVEDEDAHLGAHLIHPTRIISAEPVGEDFYNLVNAAYDALAA